MKKSHKNLSRLVKILAAGVLFGAAAAAHAVNITAEIGTGPGSSDTTAYTFVGGDDGNVWLNTNTDSGGTISHPVWLNIVGLNVSFGVGVTSPGGNPAAYAVGTDGNLYIIHQASTGSAWSTVNIGKPSGVALKHGNGVFSNTSNQPFVFLIGSDGNLWLAHNAGSWGWTNVGHPSGVTVVSSFGSINVTPSYPQSFVIGSDGNIWQAAWNGSGYTWRNVGYPSGVTISKPLGVSLGSGILPSVLMLGTDGQLWAGEWNGSSYGWSNTAPRSPGPVGSSAGNPPLDNPGEYALFNGAGTILWVYKPSVGWQTVSIASYPLATPIGITDPAGFPEVFYIGTNGHLIASVDATGPVDLGAP